MSNLSEEQRRAFQDDFYKQVLLPIEPTRIPFSEDDCFTPTILPGDVLIMTNPPLLEPLTERSHPIVFSSINGCAVVGPDGKLQMNPEQERRWNYLRIIREQMLASQEIRAEMLASQTKPNAESTSNEEEDVKEEDLSDKESPKMDA